MVISWIVNPIRASTRISTVALVGRKLLSPASGWKNTPSYNYISHYSRPGVHRNIGEKIRQLEYMFFLQKNDPHIFPQTLPTKQKNTLNGIFIPRTQYGRFIPVTFKTSCIPNSLVTEYSWDINTHGIIGGFIDILAIYLMRINQVLWCTIPSP